MKNIYFNLIFGRCLLFLILTMHRFKTAKIHKLIITS